MLRVQARKTKMQKIRLEQKTKISKSVKLKNLATDASRGSVSVWADTSTRISEKSVISVQTALKKTAKKRGMVWTKPILITTTTSKGEKRLGKGKGAVRSYNRLAKLKAGGCLFEVGPLTDFSGKTVTLATQLRLVHSKLPCQARVVGAAGQPSRINRLSPVEFTSFK